MPNSPIVRVPEEIVREVEELGEKLGVPKTEAFKIKDKFLKGEFEARRKPKPREKKDREVFEIEFKL